MDEILDFGPVEDLMQNIIKVIGVGGGGCNAVSRMYDEGIQGVSFAVCNTDSASLKHSPVPVKLQLGAGLGAGGKPEVGRAEAESSIDSIERLLDDQTKMVFVTATMGGGTGTGAAPVVARVAKERGLLTIGVVTIPFYFEHRRKIIKALKGVDELRRNVDAMLIVNNERLCDVYSDTAMSLKDALAEADNVLKNAVKGISELITISSEGNINLDFRDVESTMRNGGGAIMAIGRAGGEPYSMLLIRHCSTATTSTTPSAYCSTSMPATRHPYACWRWRRYQSSSTSWIPTSTLSGARRPMTRWATMPRSSSWLPTWAKT